MSLDEQQLRTVVLAQAIESADSEGKLVSPAEREQAGNAALETARLPGQTAATRSRLEQVVHLRARRIVELARLGSLERPRLPLRWLLIGVPLAALLLGAVTDRVANPHRVDLLSLPLLALVIWNLLIYIVLFVTWLRGLGETPVQSAPAGEKTGVFADFRRWAAGWRMRRGGPAVRATTQFLELWHGLTAELHAGRVKRVLHLAAAAWAAGIALSLLARGLVVQYQAGWESTFLDARQVHFILEVLIWPVALLFPVAPFTVEEVAGLRDFVLRGEAGARWVYLYAGLLALFVMLPRLLLAAWAGWSERQLLRRLDVDWRGDYYQDLAARLAPANIVLALFVEDRQQRSSLLRILRRHAAAGEELRLLGTAEGDEFRLATDPQRDEPADAVLLLPGVAAALPEPWRGLPVLSLTLKKISGSWVQEQRLFDLLKPALPRAKSLGLERLRLAWERQNRQRFGAAMAALATHLAETARELQAGQPSVAVLENSQARASNELLDLHRLDQASGQLVLARLRENFAPQAGLSKAQAGAAGAAAGAAVGASLDAMTAFMSLGAASALGALLGGGIGVAKAAFQQKDLSDSVLQALVEAALLRYLAVEHFSRDSQAPEALDATWKSETVAAVAAHWKTLGPLLAAARKAEATPSAELAPALEQVALGLLARVYLEPGETIQPNA
jgi:hypothetical protein